MALSYSWQDLINVGSAYAKGIPLARVNAQICDFVSSDMYIEYPWKETVTTTSTAPALIPLVDGQQDYSVTAPNISRILSVSLWNTSTTPSTVRDLDLVDDLSVDLVPKAFEMIRAVALQKGTGLLRLDSAVRVPIGMLMDLRYDYQLDPTKVVSLNQDCWFHDKYAFVALEGLLYYVYKLSDDNRAGSVTTDGEGRQTYTGQLAGWKAALNRMKMAEDYGTTDAVFPGEPMGLGRDQNSLSIFGW
jgi:hypothetical protein